MIAWFIMTETGGESRRKIGENRSVMPFDVLGHTRATLTGAASFLMRGRQPEPIC